ncbi:general substrate transporter [Annulohypoxylon truncatum]|uniref:general substrate transporter n=1 Tax=Annulohypoxylon truncatum TaxID=327061 RepID=UPI0020084B49|nr:general substrate transporter [Annulohypoxylon truncatum]KAI1213732.1 general substrate transporter [Annulohypoxylon truncatum]
MSADSDMEAKVANPQADSQHVESTKAVQSERPVWEERETYGKAGFLGIFTNKYVTLCAAFATIGGALFGYDQGVISLTLVMDQFIEKFPEVSADAAGGGFKKGLLTAMIELGAFLGAMNQGWIADKLSRKWSILVAVVIFIIGSTIQTASMNYSMLVGGRFVGGIGIGMLAMVAPLYISEIAPPEIRGTLLVLQELSIVTAIVAAFYTTYGTRYIPSEWSWRLPFLIQMIPAFFLGAGVPFLPYSPRWLASKGRNEESLQVLCKLRGVPATDERVLREWFEIRSEVLYCKERSQETHPKLHDGSLLNRFKLHIVDYTDCFRPGAWKRTHVGIGLMFFQQFGGVNALIYYSPTLFGTMGLDTQMQIDMSGVLNICQMIACFWSLWGMDRFGRRALLLGGATCMVIAHLIIAVLVGKYQTSWATHKTEGWVSVAMLLFFMLTYGATWGPIPWAMPAEIFPSSLRSKGVAFSTMSNWLNNFVIGLITPPLVQNTGFGTYIFFCVFCLLAFVWVYFVVPETNGRTLEQMDHVFHDNTGSVEAARRARIETELASSVWVDGIPGNGMANSTGHV